MIKPRCKPRAAAASPWPTGTASRPARTISAMNAAVKVTRPKTRAAISGMICSPPFRLKPESFAISNPNGAPAAAHTIAGNPTINATAIAAIGACAPVRPWRRCADLRKPGRHDHGGNDRAHEPDGLVPRDGHRQVEASVIEKNDIAEADRLSRAWQGFENGVVPEQQQQKQRGVAQDAGVDERESRQQPVG